MLTATLFNKSTPTVRAWVAVLQPSPCLHRPHTVGWTQSSVSPLSVLCLNADKHSHGILIPQKHHHTLNLDPCHVLQTLSLAQCPLHHSPPTARQTLMSFCYILQALLYLLPCIFYSLYRRLSDISSRSPISCAPLFHSSSRPSLYWSTLHPSYSRANLCINSALSFTHLTYNNTNFSLCSLTTLFCL